MYSVQSYHENRWHIVATFATKAEAIKSRDELTEFFATLRIVSPDSSQALRNHKLCISPNDPREA